MAQEAVTSAQSAEVVAMFRACARTGYEAVRSFLMAVDEQKNYPAWDSPAMRSTAKATWMKDAMTVLQGTYVSDGIEDEVFSAVVKAMALTFKGEGR